MRIADGAVMTNFVQVALLAKVLSETVVVAVVGESAIALFNVNGHVFAIDDRCMRCGSSLALGKLRGQCVACPICAWQYDVTTGRVDGLPALCADTFDVRVNGQHVMLDRDQLPVA
jgi:nitrite reductase/ring-hydroxylating ferredoxin subunit